MFIFKFGSDLSSILSEFIDSVPFWIDRIELGAFCSFFSMFRLRRYGSESQTVTALDTEQKRN